ncbi:IclR family transcriptional regulator [Tannockella kyphosi]|uniref:IclR family transcriptional regulator n=1 Tax=Tannockella kyphosi TaxID=2899121 RepID=UPI002011513B|nr:IclR family transcriptional regulator [Tannockella kyphosi]
MSDQGNLLVKSLLIIELLAKSESPMGPTEIGNVLDLNKSTVYRILKTLTNHGYAFQNEQGKYRWGPKITELASYAINNLELQVEAKPVLTALGAKLNLSVHLGILDGDNTVYIEKLDTTDNSIKYTHVGYTSPAHCSSIGKCLLSSMSLIELERRLENHTFKQYTKNTITDKEKFKRHLKKVRKQGWSMDKEEYMLGHCCVGAPIYDYQGDAVACISVSGKKQDFNDRNLPLIIEQVIESAQLISIKMGYIGY